MGRALAYPPVLRSHIACLYIGIARLGHQMQRTPDLFDKNGWSEWGKYVLKELERLNDCYEEQQKIMQQIQVEIAMLKVKSSVWGGIAGLIPSSGLLIYYIIKNLK